MPATTAGLLQLGVLLLALAAVYVPFGNHLARVYSDGRHWRVERAVYRVVRVDPRSTPGSRSTPRCRS
jgi:K+-transporting ATPase ATPase A chain